MQLNINGDKIKQKIRSIKWFGSYRVKNSCSQKREVVDGINLNLPNQNNLVNESFNKIERYDHKNLINLLQLKQWKTRQEDQTLVQIINLSKTLRNLEALGTHNPIPSWKFLKSSWLTIDLENHTTIAPQNKPSKWNWKCPIKARIRDDVLYMARDCEGGRQWWYRDNDASDSWRLAIERGGRGYLENKLS